MKAARRFKMVEEHPTHFVIEDAKGRFRMAKGGMSSARIGYIRHYDWGTPDGPVGSAADDADQRDAGFGAADSPRTDPNAGLPYDFSNLLRGTSLEAPLLMAEHALGPQSGAHPGAHPGQEIGPNGEMVLGPIPGGQTLTTQQRLDLYGAPAATQHADAGAAPTQDSFAALLAQLGGGGRSPKIPASSPVPGGSLGDLEKALDAKNAATQALGWQQEANAQHIAEAQGAQSALLRRQASEAETAHAKIEADSAPLEAWLLDPKNAPNGHRFWDNMSTTGKVGMAISQAFGAFGAALTGTPNYAKQILDDAISRDVESQRANISLKQGQLSYFLQKGYSVDHASELARASLLDATNARIQQTISDGQSRLAPALAAATIAQNQAEAVQARLNVAREISENKTRPMLVQAQINENVARTDMARAQAAGLRMETLGRGIGLGRQMQAVQAIQGAAGTDEYGAVKASPVHFMGSGFDVVPSPGGGTFFANTKEAIPKIQEASAAYQGLQTAIANFSRVAQKGATMGWGKAYTTANKEAQQARGSLQDAYVTWRKSFGQPERGSGSGDIGEHLNEMVADPAAWSQAAPMVAQMGALAQKDYRHYVSAYTYH